VLTASVRRSALAAALPPEVDAVLVTALPNVRYLTGFTGSNAAVLVPRDGEAVFATDGRYITQAAREVPDLQTLDTRTLGPDLLRTAADRGIGRVGVESEHVTLAAYDRLTAAAAGIALLPTSGLVEALRAVKDDAEVEALRTACAITDAAFTAILGALRPGVTERDVAWALWSRMREDGAEALAFDTIAAFGPHSAVPHHRPTDRRLAAGDLVKLDFGARYAGYHADMTRTVVVGPAQDWQVDVHRAVAAVQQQCRDAVRPGARGDDLGDLARTGIEAAGHPLVHGLGHGVGLEVHEEPMLTPTSTSGALREQMCVTVEPGIYVPDRGGVRIEDTVVVTAAGAEPLTTSPRELIEV
jgi:Xaa-Pro aminopeptidase